MSENLKTNWLLHILFIVLFIAADGYLYYNEFGNKSTDEADLILLKVAIVLAALILTHTIWLLVFFIKVLIKRQYPDAAIAVVFVLLNTALFVLTGFLLGVVTAVAPG